MELAGKRALVTGSTSGIGLGIARALASAGAEMVIHGLVEHDAVKELEREFPSAHFVHSNLNVRAEVEEMLAGVGRVDILVNNAGIQHTAAVEEFPVERWDTILNINLTSAFLTIRGLLPGMRERGWGRIINIASVHGLVASKHKAAYVAAKHGLVGLTKVVALETAGSGITCNAICPGWVLTPLVQAQIEDRAHREGIEVAEAGRRLLCEKQPSGQFATADELGAFVRFLCSPAAASMTGASLPVDGAWTAQ